MEEEKIYFSHYILKRTLGEGSVAKVRLAQDALTLKEYAIKIIHKGDSSTLSRIDTEIKVHGAVGWRDGGPWLMIVCLLVFRSVVGCLDLVLIRIWTFLLLILFSRESLFSL
jgi:serine/threonine protein kinase